jgi:hypothetical protein
MKNLVRSISVLAVIAISTVSSFAATTNVNETPNGAAVVGGVILLIGAIVLPAFKSSKI